MSEMICNDELAAQAKAWRGILTVREASELLGIPKRTWDNIEQGRGFPYPKLLLIGMGATFKGQDDEAS